MGEAVAPALRLRGVRKTFGSSTAVHGLDLIVPTGALYDVVACRVSPPDLKTLVRWIRES
jgi:hypothetical protein